MKNKALEGKVECTEAEFVWLEKEVVRLTLLNRQLLEACQHNLNMTSAPMTPLQTRTLRAHLKQVIDKAETLK